MINVRCNPFQLISTFFLIKNIYSVDFFKLHLRVFKESINLQIRSIILHFAKALSTFLMISENFFESISLPFLKQFYFLSFTKSL